MRPFGITAAATRFDLELNAWEQAGGLGAAFVYSTDLFDAATIERMSGHLLTLLEGVVAEPERRLSELPLLIHERGAGAARGLERDRSHAVQAPWVSTTPSSSRRSDVPERSGAPGPAREPDLPRARPSRQSPGPPLGGAGGRARKPGRDLHGAFAGDGGGPAGRRRRRARPMCRSSLPTRRSAWPTWSKTRTWPSSWRSRLFGNAWASGFRRSF